MADEYILKQAAIDATREDGKKIPTVAIRIMHDIKAIPAADVAPIVRCGRCGYWRDNDGDYGYCYAKDGQGFGHVWGKNDFCSYGERKE